MKILGLGASLRNSIRGTDCRKFVERLSNIGSKEQLRLFLANYGQIVDHRNIYNSYTNRPMSNSEIFLSAGLWAAIQKGAEVEMISLADYFGDRPLLDFSHNKLLEEIGKTDGFLLSSPVYFGDRSSLAHDFLLLIRNNKSIVEGKIFAGITVGAKRNGGQETSLIYQMYDFISQGMLAVGNDAATTSQYGGTGHAGDMGTGMRDDYGFVTSMGTGNRLVEALKIQESCYSYKLKDKVKIGILCLQDKDNHFEDFFKEQILKSSAVINAECQFFSLSKESITRCLGCTICPGTIGADSEYRCNVRNKDDVFYKLHTAFVQLDAILIGGLSPADIKGLDSVYQSFMERTRYMRRSDYIFANKLVAPLVLKDIDSNDNFAIRIMTSTIRHNTIMHCPIIFHHYKNEYMKLEQSLHNLSLFVKHAEIITLGNIIYSGAGDESVQYIPFGYTLGSKRDAEPETIKKRKKLCFARKKRCLDMFETRVSRVHV